MITVIMFIIWLVIGGYNMVLADGISKFSYFLCWVTLLIYIIANSLL